MKKIILVVCALFSLAFTDFNKDQEKEVTLLYNRFLEFYRKGDFLNAEKTLLSSFELKEPLTEVQLKSIYNNLGAIYFYLGRYKDALDFYTKAESLDVENKITLGGVYINKAIIYEIQKLYNLSIEYFEKGIRIYLENKNNESQNSNQISYAYYNFGIMYYEAGDYQTALKYLIKSSDTKNKFDLPEKDIVLASIAKTYTKLKKYGEADYFFKAGIQSVIRQNGDNYFKLVPMYFGYGQFLELTGKTDESRRVFQQALNICQKSYGNKNSLTSLAYKNLGDNQLARNNCDSALNYYQKSLISIVKNFNDPDILSNPVIDSSLFEIRLLDNLKSKSKALEIMALNQNIEESRIKLMKASLETIELAMDLIDIIRGNDNSEESRLYLAENEKETYVFAVHVSACLYSILKQDTLIYRLYNIAQRAKATVLRNDIIGNELLYSSSIPDSLRERQSILSANIAAYNKLITDENRLIKPDNNKIVFWKDALFEMNRGKEDLAQKIAIALPQYSELIRKTLPVTPEAVQKQLGKDETMIEYLLSNSYSNGKRELYIFVITRDEVKFQEHDLDSMFLKNAMILNNISATSSAPDKNGFWFDHYTGALNYMYMNLINPVEKYLTGHKIVIIPDEEIEWLPFDAFIKNKPETGKNDFEGLQFLLNDYIFSYGTSSSLFARGKPFAGRSEFFSFSPSYEMSRDELNSLDGAIHEIEKVNRWFKGTTYKGENATKSNFIEAMKHPAIFHLAMHTRSDSLNSRYSYMVFDSENGKDEGRMYNYEISLGRIKSPMVVLSACSSGTGTLYSGEGLMSLARSFILAGASSVVKTNWEINDESSSEIITQFYYYLSKGKRKNEALRLAKLDYLKKASPAFANPYYWAAYEVLGVTEPIKGTKKLFQAILIITGILATSIVLFYFFRSRRIFSDRSL